MSNRINLDHGNANAHMLVKALENVILPIIHAHVPGLAANQSSIDANGSRLKPEAQQLVSALEKFIDALVRPQRVQQGTGIKSRQGLKSPQRPTINPSPVLSRSLPVTHSFKNQATSVQSEHPRVLKLTLERIRHHAFNNMPIRLLAFKPDGTDMELIERSTIIDRISIAIVRDFYEADPQSITNNLREADSFIGTTAENVNPDHVISQYAKYAILSHTWLHGVSGEVTYDVWRAGQVDKGSAGYQKLANFCRVAATNHNVTLGWMDTICINKESSAELDESIRSMYKWYRDASVCVTYLAQTSSLRRMRYDPWFTRGWTLQELLAPEIIEFYNQYWQKFVPDLNQDDRDRLIQVEIHAATTITKQDRVSFHEDCHNIPISLRMKWAANRRVTREEDIAYSLMGLFDVGLSIAYGEGSERAFVRLVREIITLTSEARDILNWGCGLNFFHGACDISSLLPDSPKQYLWRSDTDIGWKSSTLLTPTTLTHMGLHASILLMPAISVDPASPNASWDPIGEIYATATVDLLGTDLFTPIPRMCYNVLDADAFGKPSGWNEAFDRYVTVFGILNFTETANCIKLPDDSLGYALCFHFNGILGITEMALGELKRAFTSQAVVLNIKHIDGDDGDARGMLIRKSELADHGMRLISTYL